MNTAQCRQASHLPILVGASRKSFRSRVRISNPVRSRDSISYAAGKGVEWFVTDSLDEMRRVHSVKPNAKQSVSAAKNRIPRAYYGGFRPTAC